MANHSVAPFFQLGRRVALTVEQGNAVQQINGEVMDTDTGWLAVKDETDGIVRWFNLDYIVQIQVMGYTETS